MKILGGTVVGVLAGCDAPPNNQMNPAPQPDSDRNNPPLDHSRELVLPHIPADRQGKLDGLYPLDREQAEPGEVFRVSATRNADGFPLETTYCSYPPNSRRYVCDRDFEELKRFLQEGRGVEVVRLLN